MFIVLLVSLGAVCYGIQVIYSYILMLQKRTKFFIYAFGLGSIVNLGLNIIFVPYFGIVGAAATTLFAYAIVAIVMYFESLKYLSFKVDFIFIIKSILASLVMAIIVFIINPGGIVKILLTVALGGLIYFIILFLLNGFNKQEIKIFRGMLEKNNLAEKY